ncbi:protein-L-isoaspartate O-methyltransferase [Halobium salinum]|uniref:protein-L-isoaspartate(D-aspartate) O-methyltransferase n=1 Tax=Halobium salinum TaxID=1364940 RepID=A0ABD5PCG5_9EURY|nr:protein-L-isoaspartate O-methyltransferase [Halobium salinum]
MDSAVLREDMVDGLEEALDRVDEAVGVAMRDVPREPFVPEHPYENRAGERVGTRVLAPRTVARLLTALEPDAGEDTLLVGAGVGYTAGVLAEIVGARHVHAVDINRRAVYEARDNLADAGYDAVLVDCRDGAAGLPEYAPFDNVLVEAAAVRPPQPLLDQLVPDGRLVMPLGAGGGAQTLSVVAVDDTDPAGYDVVEKVGPVLFGPLLVEGERADRVTRNRMEREDAEFAEQGYFAKSGWEYEWLDWDERLDSRGR